MAVIAPPEAPPTSPPNDPPKDYGLGGGGESPEPKQPIPWGKLCIVSLAALALFIVAAVWLY